MSYLDWGALDLAGAIDYLAQDRLPLFMVGHLKYCINRKLFWKKFALFFRIGKWRFINYLKYILMKMKPKL